MNIEVKRQTDSQADGALFPTPRETSTQHLHPGLLRGRFPESSTAEGGEGVVGGGALGVERGYMLVEGGQEGVEDAPKGSKCVRGVGWGRGES